LSTNILQGSVATCLRRDEILGYQFTANSLARLSVSKRILGKTGRHLATFWTKV